MMTEIVTVSNTLVTAILDGVDLDAEQRAELLAVAALSPDAVADVNGRTSILALHRLWSRLLQISGDPHVGLQVGAAVPGERFGLAVHAAQNSEDFRSVLRRFAKYAPLINGLIRCTLDEAEPLARLTMKFHWDALSLERHAVDITFVGVLAWSRAHVSRDFCLREVRLRHAMTSARDRYQDIFGAPTVFAAADNELRFDASWLDAPVFGANAELGAMLDRFASEEITKIPAVASLPARISQILERELRRGHRAELDEVAEELRVSPRHLQRQLKAASTSFSALQDEARKALAPAMLADPSANVEQVAFRLGFAEPTAFIRAFKKWFGRTPGAFLREKR